MSAKGFSATSLARSAVLVGLFAFAQAGVLAAEDQPPMLRNFDRFEFDTGTAKGFWLEVSSFFDSRSGLRALDTLPFENRNKFDVDTVRFESHLAIGGDNVEAGVIIPYVFTDDIRGNEPDSHEVGDVRFYLKYIAYRSHWVDAGLGYDLSTESGDASDGFGSGTTGHLPFLTATAHAGPVDVNAHFGYRFVAHDKHPAAESWVYGAAAQYPIIRNLSARLEFVGQSFYNDGSNKTALALEPGIDYTVPVGPIDVMLRPTMSVGLNNDTSDWGAGGSLVLRYRS